MLNSTYLSTDFTAVACSCHCVNVGAAGVELGVHVSDLACPVSLPSVAECEKDIFTLHQLERSNRLSELFPFVHICHCLIKSCLHQPALREYRSRLDCHICVKKHTQGARHSILIFLGPVQT